MKTASSSWPVDSANHSDGCWRVSPKNRSRNLRIEFVLGEGVSWISWQSRGLVRSDRGGTCKSLPDGPFAKDARTFFMANGGSVSYETRTGDHQIRGLVEGATPECRSPLTLLSYQTAQDELFTEATHRAFGAHAAKLLKNSADAFGHSYGQQENYEVEVASGWRLLCWRMGLLCLLPTILAYKLGAALWFACVFSLAFLTSFCRRVADWRSLWITLDWAMLGSIW